MKKGLFILVILVMTFGNVSFAQRKPILKSNATETVLKHYGVRDDVTVVPEVAVWRTIYDEHFRTTYTYDEYDYYLIEEHTKIDEGAGWMDYFMITYEYDFNGNVLEALAMSAYETGVMENEARAFYTYDDDLLSEVIYQNWEDGEWVNETKEVHNYSGDVTTVLYWDWNGNNWTSDELFTYTNDGNGTIELLIQYMQGGAWQNDEKITYTTDFSGNILEILYEDWQNNVWVNNQKTVYYYENNVYTEVLVGNWMLDDWEVQYKYEYDYADGNATHGSCNLVVSGQMVSADGDIEMAYGYNAANKTFYCTEVDMTYMDLTGLHENAEVANFKVYPIPAENEIQIQADDFQKAEIYSLTGQKMMESLQNKLNVSVLASGVYLLKVYDQAGEVGTQRIVVK